MEVITYKNTGDIHYRDVVMQITMALNLDPSGQSQASYFPSLNLVFMKHAKIVQMYLGGVILRHENKEMLVRSLEFLCFDNHNLGWLGTTIALKSFV